MREMGNSSWSLLNAALPAVQREGSMQSESFGYQCVNVTEPEVGDGNTSAEEAPVPCLSQHMSDDTVMLEIDCYSFSLVEDVPEFASLFLPVLSALGQFLVLYFVAFAQDHLFDEGHWLEPISNHAKLNVMKILAISVALFKVSTELRCARKLSQAVAIADLGGSHNRRLYGWFAIVLQYMVALSVLFVSTSVVLAGHKTAAMLQSILCVFVIVDMDNLLAQFIALMSDIRFVVRVDRKLVEAQRSEGHETCGKSTALWFMSIPIIMIFLEICIAIFYNSPPLTILRHGFVSNRDAPQMIQDSALGCCPPILVGTDDGAESTAATDSYNYSILLLAPVGSPPPRVFWHVLETSERPLMPTSLQVLEGVDADGNRALNIGHVLASRVQAAYWLQTMSKYFGHGSLTRLRPRHVYSGIASQTQLYERYMPFAASFLISGLASDGKSYRAYVVAQNPETLALAKAPVISEPLLTSVCAPRCESCEMAGQGRCDRCMTGTHRTSDARCTPCPKHCQSCGQWVLPGASWIAGDAGLAPSSSGHIPSVLPCDENSCASGYGLHSSGDCQKCLVKSCLECDYDQTVCRKCQTGWGLNATTGECAPCSHEHCICLTAGSCDACENGWGFTGNGTCAPCQKGCALCRRTERCDSCEVGFGPTKGQCALCPPHCSQCNVSGVDKCDRCDVGYGYYIKTKTCSPCLPDKCIQCNGEKPGICLDCEMGFGLTPDGSCEKCGGFCSRCDSVGLCTDCEETFTLREGSCWTCADRCERCENAGPGLCDECYPGYVFDNSTKTCLPHGLEV
eukprot:TRINITY_DN32337_c0_g2_i1.p1 TRINITY_DN32337_c0_g2~~TRINITY_DN32337_c0_g2_i1.p1  ORF type:complete len:796 (-),score=88.42 TRINITY_DN32337_c0_g2_i1:270-2657(-)